MIGVIASPISGQMSLSQVHRRRWGDGFPAHSRRSDQRSLHIEIIRLFKNAVLPLRVEAAPRGKIGDFACLCALHWLCHCPPADRAATGLLAGAAISARLVLREWMTPDRTPKVLEIGSVVLFGVLALYAVLGSPHWSVFGVRLCVDTGLLLIVLVSIVVRRPFTLQCAQEQVPATYWESPKFWRTSYIITGIWALAFGVLAAADLVLLYRPDIPPRFGIIATILALVGAIKFTSWYPERQRTV
jgi:hypothetical protein